MFLLFSCISKVLLDDLKLHQTGREGNSLVDKGYQPIKSYFLYFILRNSSFIKSVKINGFDAQTI